MNVLSKYRVLLVDDEPLFRLALRAVLDESGLPLEIGGEASDGQEALELARSMPALDLVIVDMKMPVMNGIEFLRELARLPQYAGPDSFPAAIALSAYQDYVFVREAFLLGASDYIVKVDLDERHVIPALETAIRQLEKRKRLTTIASQQMAEDKEEALRRIVSGKVTSKQEEEELCRDAGLRLPDANRVLLVIRPGRGGGSADAGADHADNAHETILRILAQVLQSQSNPMEAESVRVGGDLAVLLGDRQSRSQLYFRNKLNELLQMLQLRIWQYANVKISVGVCGPHQTRPWAEMRQEAAELASLCFFFGYGNSYYPEFRQKLALHLKAERRLPSWRDFGEASRKVLDALSASAPDLWKQTYEEWCGMAPPEYDEAAVRNRFSGFLWELGIALHEREHQWDELGDPYRRPFWLVEQCVTLDQIWNSVQELLERIHRLIHDAASQSAGVLHQAKAYIAKHYKDGITLTLVSEMVGVSESHLSKLFVKETGEKFIDYLTGIRVRKAIELMKTGMKLYEIAENVGYVNPEHFSRVFKKTTGQSPVQYRETQTGQ